MRTAERFPDDRPDHPKDDRQQPGRQADEKTRPAPDAAPAADFQGDKDRDEPAIRLMTSKLRIDPAINHEAPKADKDRGVDPVVLSRATPRASAAPGIRDGKPPELLAFQLTQSARNRHAPAQRLMVGRDQHRFTSPDVQEQDPEQSTAAANSDPTCSDG